MRPVLSRWLASIGRGPTAAASLRLVATCALLMLLWPDAAVAQRPPEPAAAPASVADQLRSLDGVLARTDDPRVEQIVKQRVAAVARSERERLAALRLDRQRLEERAAQLGPVGKGAIEPSAVRAQRADVAKRRGEVDSAIKQARLLLVAADNLGDEVRRRQAEAFNAKVTSRIPSPLLPYFWQSAVRTLPRGLERIAAFLSAQYAATRRGIVAGHGWLALLGVVFAVVLVFPLRITLRHAGQRVMIDHAPSSRFRRSGLALWLTLINTALPSLGAFALVQAFAAAGMLDPAWQPLSQAFEQALTLTALVDALGGALLQHRQPSWRLTPISDRTAILLRPWTRIAAATALISILFTAFGQAAALPAPMRDGGELLATLANLALMLCILVVIGRIRIRAADASADDTRDDRSLASIALVLLAVWISVIAAAIALGLGYLQLALMISRLLLWLPTIGGALYLLLLAVDDLCTELIAGDSTVGRTLHDAFGLRHSTFDQVGVALSATLRTILVFAAIGVAFAPFGANFDRLVAIVERLSHGISLGEVTIAPIEVLRAIAVLTIGLVVVRIARHWLADRYLPKTELDPAARHSIATIATYLGIIAVFLWSLTALGIGFQRIALILSALSVGIGFGLQAITQNFVSGLILLIERPVKIGDLVRVGDQEGDVRRIRVRATEIVTGDRSTLIVPNSELITKTVRNLTLADPIGRVQVRFAVPPGPGVLIARDIMRTLFAKAAAVLAEPEPRVSLESLDDGAAHFNCVGFVESPRQVAATRSELLFELIAALGRAGIPLNGAQEPPAAPPKAAAKDDE